MAQNDTITFYAREYAKTRVAVLTEELAQIKATFPDLGIPNGAAPKVAGPRPRQKKPMTPEQRQAVSVRMAKYWANKRKQVKKAAKAGQAAQ